MGNRDAKKIYGNGLTLSVHVELEQGNSRQRDEDLYIEINFLKKYFGWSNYIDNKYIKLYKGDCVNNEIHSLVCLLYIFSERTSIMKLPE